MTVPATTATTRSLLTRGVSLKKTSGDRRLPLRQQLILQLILLFITVTVLFPLVWIVSMALDPRNLARPDGLNLIPPGASLDAFAQGHRPADEQPDQLHRARAQQHEDRDLQRGHRGQHRDPRRLRVLAAQVPRPGGADDPRPGGADAAGRGDDHPAVHLPQPVPDRLRRPVVQPSGLARRRHAGRRSPPSSHSRSGTSRAISTRSRGTSRRRPRSTAPPRTRSFARSSCRSRSRRSR